MTSFRRPLAVLTVALGLLGQNAFAETTLRFSWWGGSDRHQSTMKAIALFEAQNPGVKIKPEYSVFKGYEKSLSTQIENGNEPDIMQVNWSALGAMTRKQDALLDLYKYRPQLNLAAFPNESYKSGLVFGRLVGLPTSYTALVFLWNKSTFDKAGLPIPKTWDQLMEAGRLFKSKLGDDYYPIATEAYGLLMMGHAYIQQKTGRPYVYSNQAKVALSHEELRDWVEFVDLMISNHVAISPQEKSNRQLTGKAIEQIPEWSTGKWSGNYTWDSTLKLRQSGWNVGTQGELGNFLMMPGARSSGMYGRPSMMLAVSKNTKNPELAVKFINFMTTDPEAGKILGTSRGTPMAKTQLDALQKGNLIQGMELKAYNQIVANKLEYPSPLYEHTKVQEFIRRVFDSHQKGLITADQAASQLLNEGNQILKSIK